MQPEQLILPTIATFALGTALLVPLRDDRLGKRATLGVHGTLLRWKFPAAAPQNVAAPDAIASAEAESMGPDEPAGTPADLEPAQASSAPNRLLSELSANVSAIGARVATFFAAPATATAPDTELATEIAEHHLVTERSFAETLDALLPQTTPSPAASDGTEDGASSASEPLVIQAAAPDPVALTVTPQTFPDRIVPLTRMPLRPQTRELTWPRLVTGAHAPETAAGRQAFLANAIKSRDVRLEPVLVAAYREEDAPGRLLALRALRGTNSSAAVEVFADALHVGSDDERSVAIDALLEANQREALAPAFGDRLDAIAAQAALAYVGSRERADYVTALAPYVDRARIETILTLLAGIVE